MSMKGNLTMHSCDNCGSGTENEQLTLCDECDAQDRLGIDQLKARVAELEAQLAEPPWRKVAALERLKEKLRHHYASGDYDRAHNCHATITLNALRQSLGL